MVFIGNPRSKTNMGGGGWIVLRSKPNYLRLLEHHVNQDRGRDGRRSRRHPNHHSRKGCPPTRPSSTPAAVGAKKRCSGRGFGRVRAWVLEVILQVIVRAGKVPPRRTWFLVGGSLEGFLRSILSGPWAFTFKRDKSRCFKSERQTLGGHLG